MKDIINTINTAGAYRTILAELHLNDSDVEFSSITMHDGLYEANLFTAWMHYECYVDAATSEVLGLNAEPLVVSAYFFISAFARLVQNDRSRFGRELGDRLGNHVV